MINSKKTLFYFFLILCIILNTACSSSYNQSNKTINQNSKVKDVSQVNESKQEETEIKVEEPEIKVEEQVILEQGDIIITLKSLQLDGMFGTALKVLVENNSQNSITVQIRDSSINGVIVDTLFSCEVGSNKKANDEIIFSRTDIEQAGIDIIKDFEFRFHVFDSQTWDGIFDSEIVTIETNADSSYLQKYNDSGTVVLEDKGFKIVMKRVDSTKSFWGADVHVYIENNSDTDATIQARDVSINGFMVNPIFSSEVLAGKKSYDTITFLESELLENDIDRIDEMELSFHIFNTNGWDGIFDSPKISVTF